MALIGSTPPGAGFLRFLSSSFVLCGAADKGGGQKSGKTG